MTEKKKGLGALAWIAIGCVGLLIVGGVIAAGGVWFLGKKAKEIKADFDNRPVETGAKAFAFLNKDVAFVSADEEKRTVVFRNEKTGEEMTFNFDDVENGNISFNTGEGEVKVSVKQEEGGGVTVQSGQGTTKIGSGGGAEDLPDWIPVYDGAEVQLGFSTSGDQGAAGAFSLKSSDSPDEVLDFYEKNLKDAGYEVQRQRVTLGDSGSQGFVTGRHADSNRTLTVTAKLDGDTTEAAVQYSASQ
jgi:hypothetical protein